MTNFNIVSAVDDVFTALVNNAHNDLYTALDGRLFFVPAPEREVFPYGTYSIVVETPNELLGNTKINTTVLQFDLYSNTSSAYEVNTLFNYLCALYDHAILNINGSSHLGFFRTNDMIMPEDDGIWHMIIRYTHERTE